MTGNELRPNQGLGVTSNLDQALDSLGGHATAKSLHLTRSLDEALGKLASPRAFQPQPEETMEATVRTVDGPDDIQHVYRLVHDAYVEKGYVDQQADGQLLYNSELDGIPETTTFLVEGGDMLLGSISVTVDGAHGLPADRDFRATIDHVRAESRKLAGVWRLVTRHGYADERRLVMALIGEAVQEALERGMETCLCSVHPKHEHFYRRLLNMKRLAYSRAVKRLQNAPGVCMRCDSEDVPEWWKR